MDILELKDKIENKTLPDDMLIFVGDNYFLSTQYINEISKIKNKPIEYVDDLSSMESNRISLFGSTINAALRVYRCEELSLTEKAKAEDNFIIVCLKLKDVPHTFDKNIVSLPTLDSWMIEDYVCSVLSGLTQEECKQLIQLCDNNIDRISNEVNKLMLFTEKAQSVAFRQFIDDGVYDDISNKTIFNLTTAIQTKDVEALRTCLLDIEKIDVEPMALATIALQNFRKMIDVWLNPRPTPENTGLKSNQIYAISKLPRKYTSTELVNAYEFLTSIDSRLKNGELSIDNMVDYIIIKLFSM